MSELEVFDSLETQLRRCSELAASLEDEFVVYVINMAILHIKKESLLFCSRTLSAIERDALEVGS
jgi:hypothetical protein